MDGSSVRIENSSRAHAASLNLLLGSEYGCELVRSEEGAWQVEVQLGELAALLVTLFERLGGWLQTEQVDSLLLHFDRRQFVLLRPSQDRLADSSGFLLARVAQLETALESRTIIEQAKGVLVHALDISPDEAFELLRTNSRSNGTKLHDLAGALIVTPQQALTLIAPRNT
jgi:hypothetical protein